MNVLFTSPVLEFPPAGGPALRIANSIKALHSVSKIFLLSRVSRNKMGGEQAEQYYKNISHYFDYLPSCRIQKNRLDSFRFNTRYRSLNRILNIPSNVINRIISPGTQQPPPDQVDAKYIINFVKRHNINIIWFGYGNISFGLMKILKKAIPNVKMVCDTDSVWSRFVLREMEIEADPARRSRIEIEGKAKEIEEIEWTNFMDVTTAVSDVDMEYYRGIAKDDSRVQLFSNVIDLEMYDRKPPSPLNFKKPCIYLAGSFWEKSPMEIAARWVINDIFPLVQKVMPELHFYIVGAGSDTVLADISNENITVTGRLNSVLPYLCNADVALVPLKFESGTRFKILEAGVCGIPIVSTTLGAEGLPVLHEEHILLADDAKEFSECILQIIRDKELAIKMAEKNRKLVADGFSVDVLSSQAKVIFSYLVG